MRSKTFLLMLLTLLTATVAPAKDEGEDALDFQEVFDLLKSQLKDLEKGALSDAAARGLIAHLDPKVKLLPKEPAKAEDESSRAEQKVMEGVFGYIRLNHLGAGAPEAFDSALAAIKKTEKLDGLIVDLRFAGGTDYSSAAKVADHFFKEQTPLLDWGEGVKSSRQKEEAIEWPMAVLINQGTTGAGEALAGVLRHAAKALLIGSSSAGEASMYRDFTLTTGQTLRIAIQPVEVADKVGLPTEGLKPDITVKVAATDEREWLKDPFKQVASADDGAPRRRINEADLVRLLEEGGIPDLTSVEGSNPTADEKLIQDPALARAVDFLKGLALLRKFQSE